MSRDLIGMGSPEMHRILIVDDEPEMVSTLTQALTELGYECVSAADGRSALRSLEGVDLVITDIMMPVMNGFSFVRELRESDQKKPVIFVSAKDATSDVVSGFDLGADDYVVKPFRLEELLARIRAALRRGRDSADMLQWNDVRLDCRRRTAHRGSWELFLSPTEFALFEFLLRHPGIVLTKSVMLEEVWHDEGFRDENIVETYVTYLRRKTEVMGQERIIHTVRGRGYVLSVDAP